MQSNLIQSLMVSLFLSMVSVVVFAADKPKIVFIDSYSSGYSWSDGIEQGIRETLPDSVELRIFRMDTKGRSVEYMEQAGAAAVEFIQAHRPEVVIACDDNASKFMVPKLPKNPPALVVCGINWSHSAYTYPPMTSGMLEVSLVRQIVDTLQRDTGLENPRLGAIGAPGTTVDQNIAAYKNILGLHFEKEYRPTDWETWQKMYLTAQEEVDILLMTTFAGVEEFDVKKAYPLVDTHTKIPTGTQFLPQAGIAMLTIAKVPQEQGRWSAQAALQFIENGSLPPWTTNQEASIHFSPEIIKTVLDKGGKAVDLIKLFKIGAKPAMR